MSEKRNKDNIGWRYCLLMMLLSFATGVLLHNIRVMYMDRRYARVWEVDKIKTMDQCERITKLAVSVISMEQPPPPELQSWIATQTDRGNVPEPLLKVYDDWHVLKATNAMIAQLEYLELKGKLPEDHILKSNCIFLGESIYEFLVDGGDPLGGD